jgi:hypothetical protein
MKKSSHIRKAGLRLVVSVPKISEFKPRDLAAALKELSRETRRPMHVKRILKLFPREVPVLVIPESSNHQIFAQLPVLPTAGIIPLLPDKVNK